MALPYVDDISGAGRPIVYAILFLVGLFALERGADWMVDKTASLAKRLRVPQTLIALLTAGAEWEELAVVLAALIGGRQGIAIGDIVGSAIANILGSFALGLMVSKKPTEVARSAKIYAAVAFVITGVACVFLSTNYTGRPAGGIMVGMFVLYIASIAWGIYRGVVEPPVDCEALYREFTGSADSDSDSDSDSDDDTVCEVDLESGGKGDKLEKLVKPEKVEESDHDSDDELVANAPRLSKQIWYKILVIIGGLMLTSLGGWLVVGCSVYFAEAAGISDQVAGLTIVSIATNLPDKVISVMAALKGHGDIIVANSAGGNVFLLSLVMGISFLTTPTLIDMKTMCFDLPILIGASFVFASVTIAGTPDRVWGFVMFVGYVAYLASQYFVQDLFVNILG